MNNFDLLEPPEGLFDRIVFAIKREQELYNTKKLVFNFLFLLTISLVSIPFSWALFSEQMINSGVIQFVSVAVGNFGLFMKFSSDFILAIVESLPITAIIIFTLNLVLIISTLRLFLHKKGLMINYLLQSV